VTGNQILFLILAAIALIGAVGVVAFGDKPVRSAISLVLNFVVLALIYFSLGSQFLGITQIMVYAGAIMVLFLFVIMILKLGSGDDVAAKPLGPPLLGILSGVVFAVIIGAAVVAPALSITESSLSPQFLAQMGKPQAIGTILFSQYVLPFEVASILLLIGVVGSILLAKRRLVMAPTQGGSNDSA
jgi:NADH-quinone oxidoreductase subunit J